jgi:hypothetical protein
MKDKRAREYVGKKDAELLVFSESQEIVQAYDRRLSILAKRS